MNIIHCTPSHSTQWDDFVMQYEMATFYHRFAWKEINEKCFGHKTFYLAAIEGNQLRGIFPIIFLKSRLFGKILCSMPFMNLGGPCTTDRETEDALLDETRKILEVNKADYLEIRSLSKLNTSLPVAEHKISMTVDLANDPEVIWKAFKSKHRTNIRNAYNQGFTTLTGGEELLDDFYKILAESWRSLGTPLYAKSYFKEITKQLAPTISIFLVLHHDKPVGTAFNGLHRKTVEGLWAGTVAEYRRSDANYVLYWEMIKHYCEAGFGKFHLGRSTVDSGAEAFKKKWLAYGSQLYWQYILGRTREIPRLNVNNPKYQLAIRAWKRLPLKLTKRIGPIIAKSIP
ncbi:MAG: FemAB family PEP-CTERM system-associated protein [Candidatus Competibacteraceae bacterium]|nr:FemAB family PEP-CTERM system-associated protein [Candidatus Competibacteraceae bacterium]